MGHEARFPPLKSSVGCRFGQQTSAGLGGNDKDAPIPDLPTLILERGGSTHSRRPKNEPVSKLKPAKRPSL
jgi:hypothetical protein